MPTQEEAITAWNTRTEAERLYDLFHAPGYFGPPPVNGLQRKEGCHDPV